jgi:hypothetical protein
MAVCYTSNQYGKGKALTRYSWSPAYIDSGVVGAYVIGLVAFAVWIAAITAGVVSPIWLGVSIVAVGIYQIGIFWLIKQYFEADKIFMIFASNILCLGLILTFVETVFGVRLPVNLPILNMFVSYVGLQATSLSPGLVAISYAVVGMLTGGLVAFVYMFIDNAKPLMRIKKALLLD